MQRKAETMEMPTTTRIGTILPEDMPDSGLRAEIEDIEKRLASLVMERTRRADADSWMPSPDEAPG